eukprot:CAMPEP_0201613628 /NCGR_PEP_ID=MMETSP0492-20130828/26559_1 /ASSEMBLY_ACC=CAM_ASM_000837 /TAXON_ID=420259 /ORGANISM="Thalassiosira gravida, Strain GMp14c1" /LENGTH=59 /DNA_ID=CAMNT_0048080605 /DNA_START=11 /DNA_END=187 /DNA_ORIENTATION=-
MSHNGRCISLRLAIAAGSDPPDVLAAADELASSSSQAATALINRLRKFSSSLSSKRRLA